MRFIKHVIKTQLIEADTQRGPHHIEEVATYHAACMGADFSGTILVLGIPRTSSDGG